MNSTIYKGSQNNLQTQSQYQRNSNLANPSQSRNVSQQPTNINFQTSNYPRPVQNNRNELRPSCYFCGKPGHTQNNCFHNPRSPQYKPQLSFPKNDSQFGQNQVQNQITSQTQNQLQPQTQFPTKPGGLFCIYCKKSGHTVDKCYNVPQNQQQRGFKAGNYNVTQNQQQDGFKAFNYPPTNQQEIPLPMQQQQMNPIPLVMQQQQINPTPLLMQQQQMNPTPSLMLQQQMNPPTILQQQWNSSINQREQNNAMEEEFPLVEGENPPIEKQNPFAWQESPFVQQDNLFTLQQQQQQQDTLNYFNMGQQNALYQQNLIEMQQSNQFIPALADPNYGFRNMMPGLSNTQTMGI